ncbi:MAG TPA: hypothetical protein VFA18_04810, partial [Gemmataceae bacterium]|nr:hypothetical protein [Gemmataceae bacterium]
MPASYNRFGLALALVLAGVAPSSLVVAGDPGDTKPKETPRVLCRFTLGALFQESKREYRNRFAKDCGLSTKQLVQAFNPCKLAVVLTRAGHSTKEETQPPTLELDVTGKQHFTLKDVDKQDVALDLNTIRVICDHVDFTETPTRLRFFINYEFDVRRRVSVLGLFDVMHEFNYWLESPRHFYDVQGHRFDVARKAPAAKPQQRRTPQHFRLADLDRLVSVSEPQ